MDENRIVGAYRYKFRYEYEDGHSSEMIIYEADDRIAWAVATDEALKRIDGGDHGRMRKIELHHYPLQSRV